MAKPPTLPPLVLEAAIAGLEAQRQQIDEHLAQLRAMLGRRGPGRPPRAGVATAEAPAPKRRRKRHMSAEGRARIAEATRKRWAALRQQQAEAAEKPTPAKKAPAKAARKLATKKRTVKKAATPPATEPATE